MPGPVPTSPANRDYQPGFTAAMMLKDLKLSQDAAKASGARTELGEQAARIYARYVESGEAGRDFSGIVRFIRGWAAYGRPFCCLTRAKKRRL